MTVHEWMLAAQTRLENAQNPDAAVDARLLVCGELNVEPGEVRFLGAKALSDKQLQSLNTALSRREAGEPLQYIQHEAWFMGLKFYVDARVLIPRQDTETLCEEALKRLYRMNAPRVLDLCTGSGALAVAIKHDCPGADVTATDLSADALDVAQMNAQANHADIRFLQGDGFAPVSSETFDMVVCNPPYLTESDMNELQTEVRREPSMALFGGEDGMDFYRTFAKALPTCLARNGYAMFEVGAGQAQDVRRLLLDAMPEGKVEIIRDICGIDRVVSIRSAN